MVKAKKGLLKKLLGKSFYIELEDALTYPSAQTICETIEKYAAESREKLEFKSRVKSIHFHLENTRYRAEIRMARGGYYISCSEL
ncbi:DUF4318 domain-containing protein [Bacillus clarus]|uniref:DUF4318 domain-containing protein n=1 Tax=Bacillus clarus TaxID=2338372 RepID=A0A090YWA9_9BACI|nr:DUF4318 domain-containing protein [Bacillus clarus]KFN02298.1 hypothetical protein DJ93_4624 [Bacillus clarus]RFT66652.1 DUF4318 domain-containing protein [Bacillus clarus]